MRHVIALAAVSALILVAALASPGHALLLALGLAAGPWLLRYLRPQAADSFTPAPSMATGSVRTAAEVFDALPLPVVLVDGRGSVVMANPPARRAYPAMQPGAPLAFALRSPELVDALAAVRADGATRSVEFVERVPVERAFTAVATAMAPGPGAEVLLLLRETSKERAIEAMRADFVANASHELRTPLASILGFIETIQGAARDDPPARERFLAIMATQARRMARLVDDLLSLSRIELKQHIAPTATVDLGAIASDVALALSELARERGVELAFSGPAEPALVLGDRDELGSAVENLVENAIKYGKAGKKVDISIESAPVGQWRLAVRDYGPGIPPAALPRLTERFYRVDNALSRAEGGTGLGLALVKHTLARHRGRLEIENAQGGGARFAIVLRAPS